MLFDLRGRGRRRTVRVIYVSLALLMGVGLVGFGIGGGLGGGGLLNAASNNEGANSASFANQVKKYAKITKQQPSNVQAWEKLTEALLHEAGGEAYVTSAGAVTGKGKELFARADQAWTSYLALSPPTPSAKLAQLVLPIYAPGGLNRPSQAVQVLQIVVAARPTSASLYASLAAYAYRAHNPREGDLASEKAVSLAPAAERPRLQSELAAVKKSPNGTETATSTSGQKFTVTRSPNGSIKARPQTTTQLPAGHPSTTKK